MTKHPSAGMTYAYPVDTQMSDTEREFTDWTDAALLEYEERLYDQEREGADTWEIRDAVIWEINRRSL